MKSSSFFLHLTMFPLFCSALWLATPANAASTDSPLVDDFATAEMMAIGLPRMIITDKDAGGQSQAKSTFAHGVMTVQGKLAPGRGSPGFVSIPLLLKPDGTARDISQFKGVKIRVKINVGSVMVQVCSADVQNFDYHISRPLTRRPAEFQEVRIPFTDLKRAWSAQTPLNLHNITSVNLVAAGMVPDSFAYEVDEVTFY
jgi:hypothetical protein